MDGWKDILGVWIGENESSKFWLSVQKKKNGSLSYEIMVIHFGGYPEHIKGMADAIYGGGFITVELPEGEAEFAAFTKRYNRTVSREGTYSQAVLHLKDDANK